MPAATTNNPVESGYALFETALGRCALIWRGGLVVGAALPEESDEKARRSLARRFPGRFVGIKDASGDLSRVTDHRRGIEGDFCQLSGDDELALPFNAAGGVGCISVTANVAPRLCAEFQQACAAGDLKLARELNDRLYPLHYAMFEDASPGPCKYALAQIHDWIAEELRLPLVPCDQNARAAVDAALRHAGLA